LFDSVYVTVIVFVEWIGHCAMDVSSGLCPFCLIFLVSLSLVRVKVR